MSDTANFDNTMKYNRRNENIQIKEILVQVYSALQEKGYDPVNQIVGYILSGDPTYITGYNNARNLLRRVERDELLEELVKNYIENC